MDSAAGTPSLGWVAPFGDPRIKACSRLPKAYRSVPRPSSPLDAKASTRCPSHTRPAPATTPPWSPARPKVGSGGERTSPWNDRSIPRGGPARDAVACIPMRDPGRPYPPERRGGDRSPPVSPAPREELPKDRIAHRHHTISSNAEAAATATARHRASRGPWGRRDGGSRSLSPTAAGRTGRASASREGGAPPELLVGPGRLERPTSRLSGVRSNQLSYGPASTAPARAAPQGAAPEGARRCGREGMCGRRAAPSSIATFPRGIASDPDRVSRAALLGSGGGRALERR